MKRIILLCALCLLATGCTYTVNNNVTTNTVDDITNQEVEDTVVVEETECPDGWMNYFQERLGVSFCYDPAWGDVVVENLDSAVPIRLGLVWVHFSNEVYEDGSTNLPSLWFEGVDHVVPDGDIGTHPCFHCMQGLTSVAEIVPLVYSKDNNPDVESRIIDTMPTWYVHEVYEDAPMGEDESYTVDKISYMTPYATGVYHGMFTIDTRYVDLLDMFMQHVRFGLVEN